MTPAPSAAWDGAGGHDVLDQHASIVFALLTTAGLGLLIGSILSREMPITEAPRG